jgi:hypothetical protein
VSPSPLFPSLSLLSPLPNPLLSLFISFSNVFKGILLPGYDIECEELPHVNSDLKMRQFLRGQSLVDAEIELICGLLAVDVQKRLTIEAAIELWNNSINPPQHPITTNYDGQV